MDGAERRTDVTASADPDKTGHRRPGSFARIAHDPDAFASFYREHVTAVTRFVARRVADPHTVADLAERCYSQLRQLCAVTARVDNLASRYAAAAAGQPHRMALSHRLVSHGLVPSHHCPHGNSDTIADQISATLSCQITEKGPLWQVQAVFRVTPTAA
jgi:hypothetical protein